MASSTDRSEDALPRPELNPLLNPLLADNMGRWAEVYFTSPPEKREEAVLDLLRELQARNAEQTRLDEATHTDPAEIPVPQLASLARDRRAEVQHCNSCGQDNPPRHQFCGMCGTKLLPSSSEELRADEVAEEGQYSYQDANGRAFNPGYAESHGEYHEPVVEESESISYESARNPYDLSLFQSLREKEAPADYEYEVSPSVRYRYYIGVILAVLIAALGYIAWRGAHANQDAQTAPPPAPVSTDNTPTSGNQDTAATQNSSPPAPSNPTNNTQPQPVSPEKRAVEPGATRPAERSEGTQTAAAERTSVPSSAPSTGSGSDEMRPQNSPGGGAEEFAVAQQYLNGGNGKSRDGAEAAKWLWKAMADHNGPAMVALADLYLKGDGVSKNCDQARVLLDSAALRGVAGAGERLRNLQAFGCQ